MKKIILAAICVIANSVMVSCTNDEVETSPKSSNNTNIVAEGSGQEAPIPPPRPKQ